MSAEDLVMDAVLGRANLLFSFFVFSLGITILPILGCGDASQREPSAEESTAVDFGGVYRVSGTTVELQTGISREISGILVLRQEGDRYSTNFDLGTSFRTDNKGSDRGRSVEVIGEGSGRVIGGVLRGSAHTQLVVAAIPGIDVRFALLPRVVSARLVSTTKAKMRPDDSIEIEIESKPAEGEVYVPTRTTLVGVRVGEVGQVPALPHVAADR